MAFLTFREDKPRSLTNLVVTDHAGKVGAIKKALSRLKLPDFMILSTGAAIFQYEPVLSPCGINQDFRETGRAPVSEVQLSLLRAWMEKADRVIVATEPDQAGDALAADIYDLVGSGKAIFRARLRALDERSIGEAFSHLESIVAEDGWPEVVRRQLDRLITCAYTAHDSEDEFDDIYIVRRLESAFLAAYRKENIPFASLRMTLPCTDGGMPFVCTLPIPSSGLDALHAMLDAATDFEASGRTVSIGESRAASPLLPWDYGQAVISLAMATNVGVQEAAATINKCYEEGRLSYPFSASCALGSFALSQIIEIADNFSVRFEPERVAYFSKRGRHHFESPFPVVGDVDICAPLLLLSAQDACLSLICRHLLACGQPHQVQRPDPSTVPAWARGFDFSRVVPQRMQPWAKRPATSGVELQHADIAVFKVLSNLQIGNIATRAAYAEQVVNNGYISDSLHLSSIGLQALSRVPAILTDIELAQAIEAEIRMPQVLGEKEDAAQQVRRVVSLMGMSSEVTRILSDR